MKLSYRIINAIIRFGLEALCRIDKKELAKVPDIGPLISYSNHTGSVEVPIMYTELQPRPITGIAKIESWDNQLLRWLFNIWGAIPIQRGEADLTAMKKSLEALNRGYILGISPEGTRNKTGQLLRAHPGLVTLALHSNAPLQPIAHWGGENFLPSLKRLRRCNFHIRVGRIFRLEKGGQRITKHIRQTMADEMMYQLAKLLPPEYRGAYANLDKATEEFIRFLD